jgi:hypothetical protein
MEQALILVACTLANRSLIIDANGYVKAFVAVYSCQIKAATLVINYYARMV